MLIGPKHADKHLTLNDWSRGEQWILFPEKLSVSREEVEGNIEIRGKQNSLFPKGPVIKWLVQYIEKQMGQSGGKQIMTLLTKKVHQRSTFGG